ncbi:MAG: prolipoprotein diacylglyceryl transferase [Christensenellaceae bacterium]|jgi:phosphatidylglycerol:prolipoprotein diacylglycerol transferase
MQPYLNLFGLEIPSYAFFIMIGYVAGLLVALVRHRPAELQLSDTFFAYIFAGIGAFLGGKLFFAIQGIPQFLALREQYGISFFDYFLAGGLVYYGACIGVVAMMFLYAKLYKVPAFKIVDTLIVSLPLAQAFGRVGCFMTGCCYGIPSQTLGVYFTASEVAPHGEPLLPIQLIEAAACLALFFVMLKMGRKPRKDGHMLGIYLLGYGIIRFVDEFFRYDAIRGIAAGLSTSQWISIIAIAAGIYLLFFFRKKTQVKNQNPSASNI